MPSLKPVGVNGDEHATQVPPSSWHWRDSGAVGFGRVIEGDAVVTAGSPVSTGLAVGATMSIVHVVLPTADTLPAASVCLTERVWLPAASPVSLTGLSQGVKVAALSSLQVSVAPTSAPTVIDGDVTLLAPVGPFGNVGAAGAAESTVHEALATGDTLPAASV